LRIELCVQNKPFTPLDVIACTVLYFVRTVQQTGLTIHWCSVVTAYVIREYRVVGPYRIPVKTVLGKKKLLFSSVRFLHVLSFLADNTKYSPQS
jgi:hypothetical protein